MTESTTSEWIIVKDSKIHGKGVFASKDIPKGTKIIEYVGKKVTKKESDDVYERDLSMSKSNEEEGAVYLFELDKKYDLDGNVSYNTARLINHSCDPNCETDIFNKHIWVIAMKDIKKDDELSYDYGFDLEDWENHVCKCGAKNCIGYIVKQEHWIKLRKKIAKKKKKSKREKKKKSTD
jgi:uncharacterized protein